MIDIPGYKIVRTLGRGGMATVYLAIQESFEREVALKVMSEALADDPKFSARFLQEARVVSRLVHPNIVTVYDVGVQGKRHYLSMEYVPGMDLKHKRQFLTPPQVLQVIRDVAKALDFASKKGYVHRDVKPENIMLHDDDGRAVLMDFGIACVANVHSGMTQTGTAIGTPHYMSPEQAKGRPVDSRSDIYSLGVVLFQLLTGHVPYDADSAVAVGIKHVQEPIPRLPANLLVLQPIIDKVLAKNPDDRYQTGSELVAAIDAITDDDIEAIELATRRYESQVGHSDPSAATVVSGQVGQVDLDAASAGSSSNNAVREEFLAVEEEDRRDFEEEAAPRSRWPWALVAALLLALAGVFYFRAYLPPQLASLVDGVAGQLGGLAGQLSHSESGPGQPAQIGSRVQPPTGSTVPEAETAVAVTAAAESSDGPALGSAQSESAPKSAGGPATPVAGQAPDSAAQAAEKALTLREQLNDDLAVAPRLAALYRDTLASAPDDRQAQQGLGDLRDFHYDRLRNALKDRKLAEATALFDSLAESFPSGGAGPAVTQEADYQGLKSTFENLRQASELVAKGNDYLAADALTSPAGANALESFQSALELDAGNPAAQAGLQKVVDRYGVLSRASLAEGELERAAELARRGLSIDSDAAPLADLLARAEAEMERRREVERLTGLGTEQLEAGNLISPRGESAYERFHQVLDLDAGNETASRAVGDIEQQIVQRIEKQINGNNFDQARALLMSAQEVLGNGERLVSLGLALEQAIEADFLARQPRIPEVLVSSQPTDSLTQAQVSTLNVDRTIYIGFKYENFEQATSVVQAMLYDGSRTVQIAQVPVIVSGKAGVKFFQIDRPVEGFSEGGYNIDLILNNKRLNTLSFKVERGQEARTSSPVLAREGS